MANIESNIRHVSSCQDKTIALCDSKIQSALRTMDQQRAKDDLNAKTTLKHITEQVNLLEQMNRSAQQQHQQNTTKLRKLVDYATSGTSEEIRKLDAKVKIFQTQIQSQCDILKTRMEDQNENWSRNMESLQNRANRSL
mmetsp:Transcript_10580/g.19833  ORF Transcript_10580/g.19833 Transcript_10580/m.19833 type:complete len:139 (+) Transcript_10580:221-637(+)